MSAAEPAIAEPASNSVRRRDLLELAIGYTLILLVIWTPRLWQRALYAATALFLATVTWRSFRSLHGIGVRRANLLRSMWIAGAAVAIAAATLLVSSRLHALHPVEGGALGLVRRYWGYALWSFVQQVLLQDFLLRRLLNLMPGRQAAAVWAAASMFALAHLPSPVLTALTVIWGYAACRLFLKYRNILPLSFAHAVLGITLSIAIPSPVIRNMRVGLGYLTYHNHSQRLYRRLQTMPDRGLTGSGAPVIETGRLILRGHRLDDFAASAAMWAEPAVTRYIGGRPFTAEETWSRLLRYPGHWSLLGYGYWAVEEKSTSSLIGELGFADYRREIDPPIDSPEMGWVFATCAHGKGYGAEGVRAALLWADQHFGPEQQTVCLIHPDNAASFKLAEKNGYLPYRHTTYKQQPAVLLARTPA